MKFADGSVGTILYTSLGDPGAPKEYVEAFADGRVIRLDDYIRLTVDAGGRRKATKGAQDKGQAQLVAAFLAAARGRAPAPIPLAEIEAVSFATLAIEEALRSLEHHPRPSCRSLRSSSPSTRRFTWPAA